ncbi:uncharacterized protein LOC126972856 isoform X2 [Leptidea sinapis]|uniref:uncharacterized protein LOC126972856 isoform X2 n=1 Tax=Leptidea sinapis TaxID=189913 RepID=UPI00212C1528|nr:uncharacterized protein LOC126972856 isoform X2 [Leptidea sinapis]
MDLPLRKSRAMTNRQVSLLLSLIQSFPILLSKDVTAVTNNLKDQAWDSVTQIFNEKKMGTPKQKEQLKMKWDNLKKAAKKKALQISMASSKPNKTSDESNVPSNNILDVVMNLLGLNSDEFDDPLHSLPHTDADMDLNNSEESNDISDQPTVIVNDSDDFERNTTSAKKRRHSVDNRNSNNEAAVFAQSMPSMSDSRNKRKGRHKKKVKRNDGTLDRNLAIAKFYQKKTEKLDIEIKLLKLELAKKKRGL